MKEEYITLKDGTEIPADDFWLRAPLWLILKYGEPIGASPAPTPEISALTSHVRGEP